MDGHGNEKGLVDGKWKLVILVRAARRKVEKERDGREQRDGVRRDRQEIDAVDGRWWLKKRRSQA